MRKTLMALVCLLLALLMSASAFAQVEIENTIVLDTNSAEVNREAGTVSVRDMEKGGYYIADAMGKRLTDKTYASISALGSGYQVCSGKGLNVWGFIDGQGNEVVPMAYGDVLYISEKWVMGAVLEEATADNYDYRGGDKLYLVTRYDVYFEAKIF